MRIYASEVIPDIADSDVELAGWVHETRDHGKIRFLILRDKSGVIQIVGKKGSTPDEVYENLALPKETVISIKGKVKSSTQAPGGVEIDPRSIEILNTVSVQLPVDPTERLISELDVRLDNRHIDLRRKSIHSIFHIQSEIIRLFRERAVMGDYEEIIPPCITGAATEGGTEVFPVVYFDREAFLAQSPQLYKQLAVIGGMERVFMTTPVFRAEKHKTTAHLNQILQMDVEIGFVDHEYAIDQLKEFFLHILKNVKKNCEQQLDRLAVDLKVPTTINTYEYSDIVDMLHKKGDKFEWGGDFGRDEEKKIYEILGEEAYVITGYPTMARAFYAMPRKDDPRICNGYDLMYKGLELASGSQRIHLPDLLIKALKDRGLNPINFEFYINAFRAGAPPHAGWSIGLERITQKITNQSNIRECSMFPRDMDRLTP